MVWALVDDSTSTLCHHFKFAIRLVVLPVYFVAVWHFANYISLTKLSVFFVKPVVLLNSHL